MINENVIKEIYRRFKKPVKDQSELNLPYFQQLLQTHNPIEVGDEMITIRNMEEFSPFKRFLIRSLTTVLELDKMVAFVFNTHIVFMNKDSEATHVHLRPEPKKGLLARMFGKR